MKTTKILGMAVLLLPLFVAAESAPTIEISRTSNYWRFDSYKVIEKDGISIVAVKLMERPAGYIKSHFQAEAFDKDGKLIAVSECRKTPGRLGRRLRQWGGRYSQAEFNVLLPADATVKLGFLDNRKCAPPSQ